MFPLGFIYPVQTTAYHAGLISTPSALVLTGRVVVALLSSVGIWLVWRAARDIWPAAPGYGVVAALLFATAGLNMSFGSSELPRPVAAAFILGAYVQLRRPGVRRQVLGGMLLGVAACFRFSEAAFVGVAVAASVPRSGWRAVVLLAASAGTAFLLIVGWTDYWYWGDAFHSLRAAIDYTLVQRLSSRGYQTIGWYLLHVADWLSPSVAVLAVIGTWIRRRDPLILWAWLPVCLLSALPHKEARYAIPAIAFLILIATEGLTGTLDHVLKADVPHHAWKAPALVALIGLGLLHDAGHWRLPRTNGDVVFAMTASAIIPPQAVISAEQPWRLGGHIYLGSRQIVELDPARMMDPSYLSDAIPRGSWLMVDRRTSAARDSIHLFGLNGYVIEPVSVRDSHYALWRPATE